MLSINKINKEYFDWMCSVIKLDDKINYKSLLLYLHNINFTYTIPMDGNRAEDGIELRYRFGNERNKVYEVANYLDIYDCSMLEMMVALAMRCEEHIMFNPDIGDRTGKWFWSMIKSLGLTDMTDRRFDSDVVDAVVERFLCHKYKSNGEGGLFTLKHYLRNLRYVEIWCQAMWFLNEYIQQEEQ